MMNPNVGRTIVVDHHVTTFTVEVRHMNTVTAETIKRILETKLEVLKVEETDSKTHALYKARD